MAINIKKYDSDELLDAERPLRLQHRFLLLRKLGQGTYGKVQLALNKETNEEVAVKTIKKARIENAEDMLRIRREIHIMTALRHPNIIHINEVFETRQKIVIVMQYASGGELYDYLGCHQTLPEDEARRIFRQISSAIYYCHKNQICHRDLKLENILLDEEGNAKIADFGLSNIFDDNRRMNTFCGSPLYASPEIVKGTPYKGPEVDCWSLGVLLYTLVYGTMPFDGRSFKELVSQISEGRYEEPINRSNASSLIRWLLTPEIARRATITDVCKDSWVNQGYDVSLLEVAENMAVMAGLTPRERINVNKLCHESNAKNGKDKSVFKKAAEQLEEKVGKFTSLFTKNLENIPKTNDVNSQTQNSNLYDQITNYDVRFVLNKLIAAVEASLNADKNSRNLAAMKASVSKLNKIEIQSEKVDSAYVIPIFEVTSVIPNERLDNAKNAIPVDVETNSSVTKEMPTNSVAESENFEKSSHQIQTQNKDAVNIQSCSENKNTLKNDIKISAIHAQSHMLTDSQKQYYSMNIFGQSDVHKTDFQTKKRQLAHSLLRQPSPKSKQMNDPLPINHKHPGPFMRTKHNVLSLARLLSLNYEKLMRNSFRMQPCKKKLPGKITIPPTFDPNNPPPTAKKQQDDKKELFIFPTVSVSENKEKIQKKIEKIKKAALDKNIIIRSDTTTRMRIENYIRSQVKKMQDLCDEQRSLHGSLDHLDEQSLRDMSEMYYRAFGSENTDSGIANTEEEEYFCFLCSKPNDAKGAPGVLDSFVLESIKKGCLYTSNHLHIPKAKEQNRWGYTTNNGEFGSLSRCKSEIEFPTDYLNYISYNNKKSDLNKRTQLKQQIQRSNIGNTKCFLTLSSENNSDGSNYRILRSASDSVGLNLSKNTFEVLKLNTNENNDIRNYNLFPHFLEQTSSRCNYSQMTDYDVQSTATDATFINTSHTLDKDDGIGDSNDSFQSYIDNLENNIENDELHGIASSSSCTNFQKGSFHNQYSSTKMSSEPLLKNKYDNDYDSERQSNASVDILDSTTWVSKFEKENEFFKGRDNKGGLRKHNTMSCVRDGCEIDPDFSTDQTSTEFENYLWNAYKEHLLDDCQNDTAHSSSPNLNYYSLDRKAKFRRNDSKSMDMNGDLGNDFVTKLLASLQSSEQDLNTLSSTALKNNSKHSNAMKNVPDRSASRLSRTKSVCGEMLTDSDRNEMIRKLRAERKLSHGNDVYDTNNGNRSPFMSDFLNDFEKKEHGRKADDLNRRRYSKSNLPHSKRNKSEYKKSFLQLLALKRIQEAEKELDKSPRSELPNVEEENSGSLLEALKTHGYKGVISQRFQDTSEDDYLDPFHMKYSKSPRNLRAELARLNYMYYESLPRYSLDLYDENDYLYNDSDYTSNMLNGLQAPTYYDMPTDFRQLPKQPTHDWLDTAQIDEYLNTLRSDLLYNPEETITPDIRRRCTQRNRENYRPLEEESSVELQDTEEIPSGAFNGNFKIRNHNFSSETSNSSNNEGSQIHSALSDDEKHESVQDRIWRKSFYSRFNNRALSRKRSSIVEPELSESRLGLLNNLYNNPPKSGFEKSEFLQRDGSNKSFHTKKSKKHSPSFDKFESRSSMIKKYPKSSKEREILHSDVSSSDKEFINVCNREPENEEPEPEH